METSRTPMEELVVGVRNLEGDQVGSLELPREWFGGPINVPVMHQVVTAQLAAARNNTAKTKGRGEVRGGSRKPWRQKGTGRARHGSIRAPQWVGGGVAHGRSGEQDHRKRVNKKMKRLALRSALSDRAREGNVSVVRELVFTRPRTKDAIAALTALGHESAKVLVVLADRHDATWKSFRNLPAVHALIVDQLNTYDVLLSDVVVFDEAALPLIGTGRRTSAAASSSSPSVSVGEDSE
ncbi:MAG: 50S ribosomal protein L4 [Actinomycetota bacterium]|nr:50S ribosomal protein L4 [Actinomycetota bacterium]